MEPAEALSLLRKAGDTPCLSPVFLSAGRSYRGITQPHYTIEMTEADDSDVFLGVNDKSVWLHS